MIFLVGALLLMGLTVLLSVRHFILQVVALKALIGGSVLLIILSAPESQTPVAQAIAWIVSALGMICLFLLMAVAARRFSKSNSLNAEDET